VVSRREELDPWLAIPFGVGVALTLDESALLLKLDDVYWTEDGIVSVQISLAAVAMLSSLTLVLRVLRRGERAVLPVYTSR
jgi:urease accessory protein UreE